MHVSRIIAAACALFLVPAIGRARSESSAEEVAQTLANPAASVTALGAQLRVQQGAGNNGSNALLRLQPIIPFTLPNNWALLTRTILPILATQHPEHAFGLSDTSFSAYFVPPPNGPWFLGFGPSVSLPTTTQRSLGSRNYAAGPTAIVARQGNPVTAGFLATHLWTAAMPEAAPLRTTSSTFQPFLAYNLGSGRTVTVNTEVIYNWELPAGRQWVMPVSAGLSQVVPLGDRFLQLGGALTYYAIPQAGGGGNWEFRLNATLVLPR